jgi:hypothetical protein
MKAWIERVDGALCRGTRAVCHALALLIVWPALAGEPRDRDTEFERVIKPLLTEHCFDCHGDGMSRGNVAFDAYPTPEELLANHRLWLAVLKNVRAEIMPPERRERLSPAEFRQLEDWIKYQVFGIDPDNPDPGRVTIRRLNRVEYRNTIRDLMGIDYNSEVEFPPDDTGHGFDNIADVLTVSPLLLEKYLEAAVAIVDQAVPTVARVIPSRRFSGRDFRDARGEHNGESMSFYEGRQVTRALRIDHPGEYRVTVEAEVRGSFDYDPGRCRVSFKINDREMFTGEYVWRERERIDLEYVKGWEPGEQRFSFELEPLADIKEQRNPLNFRVISVRVEGPMDMRSYLIWRAGAS